MEQYAGDVRGYLAQSERTTAPATHTTTIATPDNNGAVAIASPGVTQQVNAPTTSASLAKSARAALARTPRWEVGVTIGGFIVAVISMVAAIVQVFAG
jgi:hypothetical protein